MTIQEYNERRKAKDKEDMRFYIREFMYWCRLIPIALFAYLVIGATLSVFG